MNLKHLSSDGLHRQHTILSQQISLQPPQKKPPPFFKPIEQEKIVVAGCSCYAPNGEIFCPPPPPPLRGYDSSHFLRTENSFGIIWSSPRQLRVKNTLRVGHRGPVGRKTTQKPPQNTKKWKKIVKKRLFDGFGHVGQNSDFSRKNQKNGYVLTSQSLLWHKYTPKVACESIPTCFGHI